MIFLRNSFSFKILTPNCVAFSIFEPAFSPAIRKSVFLLILDNIFAPLVLAKYLASSLDNSDKVPVKTKCLFEKKLSIVSFSINIIVK